MIPFSFSSLSKGTKKTTTGGKRSWSASKVGGRGSSSDHIPPSTRYTSTRCPGPLDPAVPHQCLTGSRALKALKGGLWVRWDYGKSQLDLLMLHGFIQSFAYENVIFYPYGTSIVGSWTTYLRKQFPSHYDVWHWQIMPQVEVKINNCSDHHLIIIEMRVRPCNCACLFVTISLKRFEMGKRACDHENGGNEDHYKIPWCWHSIRLVAKAQEEPQLNSTGHVVIATLPPPHPAPTKKKQLKNWSN